MTPTLALNDPTTWPLRMRRDEVAAVLRIAPRTLFERIEAGRFPPPDDGRSWARKVVLDYVEGGIRRFEEQAARTARRLKVAR